jgi:hypothetical protein
MNNGSLKSKFDEELKKAIKINEQSPKDSGIDLFRALIFVLQRYNSGNYYGTIALKFTGTMIQNPRELEVTHRLEVEIKD